MPRLRLVTFGVFIIALAGWLPAGELGSADLHTGIAVDVTVKPMDAARTQFMCQIRVTELPSDQLISGINLQLIPGRPAMAASTQRAAGEVSVLARVEQGGTAASYSVEYRKGAVVVATQKGSISLTPEASPQ
jgi:hypothetical protein